MSRNTIHLLLFLAVAWILYVHFVRKVPVKQQG